MEQLQAGFIFLAPGADYQTDHQLVETPGKPTFMALKVC